MSEGKRDGRRKGDKDIGMERWREREKVGERKEGRRGRIKDRSE
jgi:hypothetical protein